MAYLVIVKKLEERTAGYGYGSSDKVEPEHLALQQRFDKLDVGALVRFLNPSAVTIPNPVIAELSGDSLAAVTRAIRLASAVHKQKVKKIRKTK